MLLPKRTKFRRLHRGRLKGIATKSNTVVFGDYGIQALEPIWLTSRQIEVLHDMFVEQVNFGFVSFQINQLLKEQLNREWVQEKVHQVIG